MIDGNAHLIEILVNNLFNNATKHNTEGGSISVVLNDDLQIINTGINHSLDETQLFKRFSKANQCCRKPGPGFINYSTDMHYCRL